jgi:hypothetical protein
MPLLLSAASSLIPGDGFVLSKVKIDGQTGSLLLEAEPFPGLSGAPGASAGLRGPRLEEDCG